MSYSNGINPAITPAMMANPMIPDKSPLAPPTPVPLGVQTSPTFQGPGGQIINMFA